MDYLPDDIVTQILVKVPCSKSMLRCTSVCKPWYSLIKSPVFIALHLHRPNNTKYLLCDYKPLKTVCFNKERYLSIHHDDEAFVEHYRLTIPGKLSNKILIHGCCNGLICYAEPYDGLIYLWNPTIRKIKVLPRYRNYGISGFGFWFDKRVNDYMVAKISAKGGLCIDVYSLSTNSWKTIAESIPVKSLGAGRELAYVDGTLHWPVESSSGWMICSLDIKSGLLRETLLSWGSNKKLSRCYLTPLGEHSLVVFGSKYVMGTGPWRCCMVQVYDQNLNKLHTIDLEKETCHELQRVIGLTNNGEALFSKLNCDHSGIISCTTKSKDFKEFIPKMTVIVEHGGSIPYLPNRVRPFFETLVLLNDGDDEETSTPKHQLISKSKFPGFIWLVFLCLSSYILYFLIYFS